MRRDERANAAWVLRDVLRVSRVLLSAYRVHVCEAWQDIAGTGGVEA
jgi:hypothetical protein